MSVKPRDISPLLQMLRNFLLGRKHTTALRFQQNVASRSPPPPDLPDGPCHELNNNYYFARDVRREVKPPALLDPAAITSGVEEQNKSAASVCCGSGKSNKPPTPGLVYRWD